MAISKFNYNSFNVTPVAGAALAFDADADGFSTATSTALTHIKTLTASSSGTLSFVDGSSSVVFDNTYPVYLFKFISIHAGTDEAFITFNMSADTGSNYNVTKTSTFFRTAHDEGDTTTQFQIDNQGVQPGSATDFAKISKTLGNDNDQSGSGELYIFNPSSTTFVKHFLARSSISNPNDYLYDTYVGGYGNTTSAVDAIQFKMNTGNIDAGTIKLYGIKDS